MTPKEREKAISKINEVIIGRPKEKLYRCNRVREAWECGTMTADDFEEVDVNDVMLGDVLDWIYKHGPSYAVVDLLWTGKELGGLRKHKGKQLEEQSDETILYLLSLIDQGKN